jgi:hypothetical protein
MNSKSIMAMVIIAAATVALIPALLVSAYAQAATPMTPRTPSPSPSTSNTVGPENINQAQTQNGFGGDGGAGGTSIFGGDANGGNGGSVSQSQSQGFCKQIAQSEGGDASNTDIGIANNSSNSIGKDCS